MNKLTIPMIWLALAGMLAACTRPGSDIATPVTANSPAASTVVTPTAPLPSTTSEAPIVEAATPPSTQALIPSTTTPTTAPITETCLNQLSMRQRVALLVWPAAYTDNWNTAVTAVGDLGIGGVLLMKPSDGITEAELTTLITQLDTASELGLLIATDEEGGAVQRLRSLAPLDSQADIADQFTPAEAKNIIQTHGKLLNRVGIDVVLGPVVDVLPTSGTASLNPTRFFSDDPALVSSFGTAYVDGWLDAGLIPVLKHFPGHGSASMDTHDGGATTPPLDELIARDLAPYTSLTNRSNELGVMLGHLTVPGLTDGRPASLSPDAIDYLRTELGYDSALIVTDALEMGAVTMPVPEAAVTAIAAGADVVIFTETGAAPAVIDALDNAAAQGDIAPERINDAAGRVLQLLEDRGGGCP